MSYNVISIPPFDKQIKRLVKKYPSLKTEFALLLNLLEVNPKQGTLLMKSCYKIRIAIKSKGKGKSGGARIITHFQVSKGKVYLLTIYDKSEQSDLKDNELNQLLNFIE
jgi:mRNA-degrading endonuclease RelE of RelBE toxin-antitoxin system